MRHRKNSAILNRPADQRKALIRNLITSLFLYGKVQTTEAKAKALQPAAEKLITKVKSQDDMNAIRSAMQVVYTEDASKALLAYAKKTTKTSGFTRVTRIGYRAGDNALKVQVELITDESI
ncbi:MAG TPA: 50S ribosomal protein L17 [Candidatus Gracilibacteria bacterium]